MKYDGRRRTWRFRRGKTNVPVEMEIVGELAVALEPLLSPGAVGCNVRVGHNSVRTTEIVLKQLLAEIVPPNQRPIVPEPGK